MSGELSNGLVLTPPSSGGGGGGSILFFPSVLCQIFGVCVRSSSPVLMSDGMQNITAMRGDSVEFRCRVQDVGKHMVAFFRDEIPPRLIAFDESVFRQHEKYILKARVNKDEWILRIRDVDESDIGGYICQLNSNPILTKSAYLNLKIPPTVSRSSTPSAVEVREGHNVTLTCHAEGNPTPTVIWRRQDRQIIRYNGANGYGESVYKGSQLRLSRVSRKHMSEYVCVASNGIPPDESWTIKLHVLFEPIVIPQTMVVEAPIGAMVRLVCNVEAWPRPLVTWFLDDAQLFDSNRFATEQSVSERYKSVHILEIKEVSIGEFGRYRCVAINDYGKHFADIQLIEIPPPSSNSISTLTEGSGNSHIYNDEDLEFGDTIDSSSTNIEYPQLLFYDSKDSSVLQRESDIPKNFGMDYRRRAADSFLRGDNEIDAYDMKNNSIDYKKELRRDLIDEIDFSTTINSPSHASGILFSSFLQYPLLNALTVVIWVITLVMLNPVVAQI